MSSDDRFIDKLEDYLDQIDGETPLPVHVRDSIRAQLPGTGQIRSGSGPRRVLTMVTELSTPARVGLVAAALVVAVGLGAAVMANNAPRGGIGAEPSTPVATPVPTTAPTAAPSASANVPSIASLDLVPCKEGAESFDTCLPAGTYQFRSGELPDQATVDLPAGWWYWDPGPGMEGVLVGGVGADAPEGSGWGVVLSTVAGVRRDPCDAAAGTFASDEVDTPEELAEAMATWPAFDVVTTEAITLGDVSGVKVVVETTEDLGACVIKLWQTKQASDVDAYPLGTAGPGEYSVTFHIVDVNGELVAIRSTDSPQTSPFELTQGVAPDPDRHADRIREQQAIIDSIRFGVLAP